MKARILFLILFFSLASFVMAEQQVIQFREGMQIEVAVTSEYATEIFFPDNISKVIPQISSQVLSWEHVLNRLYLGLRAYGPKGSIIVITQDGFSYSLLVRTVETGGDKSIKILNPKAEKQGTPTGNRVLDMMKAMMTNTTLPGLKVSASPSLPEAWKRDSIVMLLEKTYTSPKYVGFIFQVINTADHSVPVPIQQIESREYHILAVSVDAVELKKCGTEGSTTTMYLIRGKEKK